MLDKVVVHDERELPHIPELYYVPVDKVNTSVHTYCTYVFMCVQCITIHVCTVCVSLFMYSYVCVSPLSCEVCGDSAHMYVRTHVACCVGVIKGNTVHTFILT